MENKILKTNRGEVHYWINKNSNDCIVFTHGMTMDHQMFQDQMNYFKDKYTVISWDAPLHGKSRPYNDFNYINTTQDLNLILEQEGINQVHLVGQSMGGYIIQEYALYFAEKVLSLTMIDSSPFGLEYYSKIDRWILSHFALLSRFYPYHFLISSISKSISKTKRTKELAYNTLLKMSKKELLYIMDVVYKELLERKFKNHFNIPVLLVYGDSDVTGKVKVYNEQWKRNENYALEIIPNAAHNSNVDNPEHFNKTLETFYNNCMNKVL